MWQWEGPREHNTFAHIHNTHTHTHVVQTGVPQFLDMMRKAVFGYEKWLKDTGREAVKPPEVSLKITTTKSS